jgi:hypothetical protein
VKIIPDRRRLKNTTRGRRERIERNIVILLSTYFDLLNSFYSGLFSHNHPAK